MRDPHRKGVWRRRIVLVSGGIILLLLLVRGVMDWSAAAAMEETLGDFQRRWGPLDPAEAGPPEIPPAENRARCFRAAMALLELDAREDHETLRGRGNALTVAQAVARDPNAVREILERNRLPLELVDEALHRSGSDWEIPYEKGVEAPAPRLVELLNLSRVVAAAGALAVVEKDPEAALSRLQEGLHLASSLKQEPMIMTYVVGVSMEAEMMAVLRSLLATQSLGPEQLESLRVTLAEVPGERAFHDALKNEVTAMHMAMADITAGARSEVLDSEPVFTERLAKWAVRPVIRRAHSLYLQEMDKIIDRQGTPRYRRPELVENREIPWYGKLFATVPNMERLLLRADLSQARRRLAWTAVAILRHAQATGAPPARLEDLVPAYMDEVPLDPFTGKPLEYAVDAGKVRLKSAGEASAGETGIDRDPVTTWEILT